MRAVGLDWAVDPDDRAAVILEKQADGIYVVEVSSPVADQDASDRCKCHENDVVAVDIPFAWPRDFRDFVSKWRPFDGTVNQPPDCIEFRYRKTDRFVHNRTNKWPLSVSSNLFALRNYPKTRLTAL